MECGTSIPKNNTKELTPIDKYNSTLKQLDSVTFKVTNVVFGLDFARTCKDHHKSLLGQRNPFERVLFTLFNFFIKLYADSSIPMYSFGDKVHKTKQLD